MKNIQCCKCFFLEKAKWLSRLKKAMKMKGYNYMYNADEQWLPFIRLLTIVLPIKLWQFTECWYWIIYKHSTLYFRWQGLSRTITKLLDMSYLVHGITRWMDLKLSIHGPRPLQWHNLPPPPTRARPRLYLQCHCGRKTQLCKYA